MEDKSSEINNDSPVDGNELLQKKRERDNINTPEGPNTFKKARFAWQIKGEKKCVPTEVSTTSANSTLKNEYDLSCKVEERGFNDKFCYSKQVPITMSLVDGESAKKEDSDDTTPGVDFGLQNTCRKTGDTDKEMHDESSPGEPVTKNEDLGNNSLAFMQPEEGVRSLSSSYWERRAPFDILRTTVNFAANSQCLSALWQKEELGCAIVDNVFNRTLEEIGISPDQKSNKVVRFIERALENQGIETAIRHQGLRSNVSIIQSHTLSPPQYQEEDSGRQLTSTKQAEEMTVESTKNQRGDEELNNPQTPEEYLSISLRERDCTGSIEKSSQPQTSNNGTSCQDTNLFNKESQDPGHCSHLEQNVFTLPKTGDDSEVLLDLAVSAAILAQGLEVKND